jgi:hypothetical protein
MARKYIKGYTIEDVKVGMKIREKGDSEGIYEVIVNVSDIHNVETVIYSKEGKRIGMGLYCLDKRCQYEYSGGKFDILQDDNGESKEKTAGTSGNK